MCVYISLPLPHSGEMRLVGMDDDGDDAVDDEKEYGEGGRLLV